MFLRRGARSRRLMGVRTALLFLGAGTWLAGVWADNRWITGAAILIFLVGMAIGLIARRTP